jgi:exodeoxyribonuclease V alpha subunit
VTAALVLPPSVAALGPFVDAGVFGVAEVHLAETIARLRRRVEPADGGADPTLPPALSVEEVLALAVAARAPRLGHVGIELDGVAARIVERGADDDVDLPWPDPAAWAAALERSELVDLVAASVEGGEPTEAADPGAPLRPLVWDGHRLYLHRYYAYEVAVADDIVRRAGGDHVDALAGVDLDGLFPPAPDGFPDRQRTAAEIALSSPLSVIAGGPGTGKTRTVARLLAAALTASGPVREFALAAPTGKAAARMTEAVHAAVAETEAAGIVDATVGARLRGTEATTIHRLLGARPGGGFARDRHRPLPHDLVIVDETSMVALPLMARLLDAVRPDARVVFVGDPDQLASVEAGTVLGDLVGPTRGIGTDDPIGGGPLSGRVTVLDRVHRFGAGSGIAELADAVRTGDLDRVVGLLDGSRPDLELVAPSAADDVLDRLVGAGVDAVEAARAGLATEALDAATRIKVLAAVHHGTNGRLDWERRTERAVFDRVGDLERRGRWYAGRPVLVTGNDRLNHVFNGDTGVTVAVEGTGLQVALADGRAADGIRLLPPARLNDLETWWSMTIHKSQGSEFPHVVVALPPAGTAPVLTRELLYTAITRARERVTLVATGEALRRAVARPVARASGLGPRLWSHGT